MKKWSFDYQWRNFNTELLYGMTLQEEFDRFLKSLDITLDDLKNKKVLDAGCGCGRLTKEISKYAKETIGIDLASLPKHHKVKFIKGNIENLDFDDKYFDYVFCEGVLHHTANPKKAFKELTRVTKRRLFVLVYSKYNSIMWLRKRLHTYRFPLWFLKPLSYLLTFIYYLPRKIEYVSNKASKRVTLASLSLLIFDSLSPKYLSKHSFKEVEMWFKEAGYKKIIKFPGISNKILGIK